MLADTTFEYARPVFDPAAAKLPWEGRLNVSMTLRNNGTMLAKEVVQLYVHDVVASKVRPIRELKGFQKIELAPVRHCYPFVKFRVLGSNCSFGSVCATTSFGA